MTIGELEESVWVQFGPIIIGFGKWDIGSRETISKSIIRFTSKKIATELFSCFTKINQHQFIRYRLRSACVVWGPSVAHCPL